MIELLLKILLHVADDRIMLTIKRVRKRGTQGENESYSTFLLIKKNIGHIEFKWKYCKTRINKNAS